MLKLLVPILGAGTIALVLTIIALFKKAKAAVPKPKPGAKKEEPAAPPVAAAAGAVHAPTDHAKDEAEAEAHASVLDLRHSFALAMDALKQWAPRPADRLQAPWVLSIGRVRAGKSSMLESLPLERLGEWSSGQTYVGTSPCRFHFFERGVVLDLSGSMLGGSKGSLGREVAWKGLVTLLQRHRPERPVDSVVLSIPMTDLVGPERMTKEELEREGARLHGCLQQLSLGLGLQIPVYVLITQCDQVPGFSAFGRDQTEERRREMLGWSSPYALNTTFSPEWVDEAIGVVSRRVQDLEFATWSDDTEPSDGDDLLAFPSWLAATVPALRTQLARVFRMSAYEPAFPLRGIYFTGDVERAPRITETVTRASAAPIEAPVRETTNMSSATKGGPRVKAAFVADLFNDKIFAEHGLARVARRTALSKNRLVATMQLATAAILLIGPIGIYYTVNGLRLGSWTVAAGLREETSSIEPLLKAIASAGHDIKESRPEGNSEIFTVLDHMANVRSGQLRALFLPPSWLSPLHGQIRDALQTAFSGILFPEFRDKLHQQMQVVLGEGDHSTVVQTGQSLPGYLASVHQLSDGIQRYNHIGTAGAGSTRELAQLVEYLYPTEQIAPGFFENDDYYRDALVSTQVDPIIVTAAEQGNAMRRATELIAESYTSLVTRLNKTPASADSDDASDESFKADVAAVVGLRAFLDTAGPVEHALTAIKPPFSFGDNFAPKVHASLVSYRDRLTGELATERYAETSGATLRALDLLLRQPFMQATTGRDIPTDLDAETTLRWDVQRLDQAIELHGEFDKFVAHGLDSLPDGVRGNVRRLATAQVAAAMADRVSEAAIFSSAPSMARAESERDLKNRIAAFDQGMERVGRIMDLFDTMGATPLVDDLDALTTAHASQLLTRLNTMVDLSRRFTLPAAAVATWNGQAPFSATLGAKENGIAEYFAGEQQTVRSTANLGRTVIAYLDSRGELDGDIARSLRAWHDVLDALDKGDAKPPTGPLASIERTVVADVDSVDVKTCVRKPLRMLGGSDLVTKRINDIRQQVWRRCVDVATGNARTSYAQLEETFRTHLAGHFPFATSVTAPDASAADIVAFFRQFDALSPDAVTASGSNAQKVSGFLAELEDVRRFLAPMIDSASRPPTYDYSIDFRVNRGAEVGGNQIADWAADIGAQHASIDAPDASRHGRWRAGDTVHVALRWATGSQVVPFDIMGPNGSAHDGEMEIGFGGRWGLLRFLRAYASDVTDDTGGHILAIVGQTARRQAPSDPTATTRVFLRVRLNHPDTKADLHLPHFPTAAPGATAEARR